MIALNWLEELIGYAIASPFLKDEIPVSLMVISKIEAGKSAVLSKFSNIPSVMYQTDFTRYGILKEWLPAIEHKEKRTIVVPDIVALLESKNPSGKGALLGFLTSLTEEGITSIETYQISHRFKEPIRCNIILGAPEVVLHDQRRWRAWSGIGLTSRLLPVSYRYNHNSVAEILEYIMHRTWVTEPLSQLNTPISDTLVNIDYNLAKQLLGITQKISSMIGTYGFRIQRQAQTLAMSRALLKGRNNVEQEDIDRIIELLFWVNLKFEPVRI